MKRIRLYADEDAMHSVIITTLRGRNIDVVTANDAAMVNRDDEDHLMAAVGMSRSLYSFNTGDYNRLHRNWLANGQSHAGIIIGFQHRYSLGQQLAQISRLIARVPAHEMRNRLEFLSNWGEGA